MEAAPDAFIDLLIGLQTGESRFILPRLTISVLAKMSMALSPKNDR
jgi:hypothetical protein